MGFLAHGSAKEHWASYPGRRDLAALLLLSPDSAAAVCALPLWADALRQRRPVTAPSALEEAGGDAYAAYMAYKRVLSDHGLPSPDASWPLDPGAVSAGLVGYDCARRAARYTLPNLELEINIFDDHMTTCALT